MVLSQTKLLDSWSTFPESSKRILFAVPEVIGVVPTAREEDPPVIFTVTKAPVAETEETPEPVNKIPVAPAVTCPVGPETATEDPVPEVPEEPEVPEDPEVPDVPEDPEDPDVPDDPEVPEVPDEPLVPAIAPTDVRTKE